MTRSVVTVGLVAASLLWCGNAYAQSRTIKVRVVDRTLSEAYVSPGTKAGVNEGTTLTFGKRKFKVVRASSEFAVVKARGDRPKLGERGRARPTRRSRTRVKRRPEPPSLASYRGQWRDPTLPATTQSPAYIPLGRVADEDSNHVRVSTNAYVVAPLSGGSTFARLDLRTELHTQAKNAPLAFDLDASVQAWLGANLSNRSGSASRPWVRVRQLQLSYGTEASVHAALGRLGYAAATIGQLDGARVATPRFGGFKVAAFGGFVPDPLDGVPSIRTTRFGIEASYEDFEAKARPRLSLTAHGSTYRGEIDERRLQATFDVFPGDARLGGHVELSLHDSANPWGASAFEVSAAGIDASAQRGVFEVGGRFDMRLPERSMWLDAFLPIGYLCESVPATPATASDDLRCDSGRQARYYGDLWAGLRFERFSVRSGGHLVHTEGDGSLEGFGGFVQGRLFRIAEHMRADLTLSTNQSALVDTHAAQAGVGLDLLDDRLDFYGHYRIALRSYDASPDSWLEHVVGGGMYLSIRDDLDLRGSADAILGRDLKTFVVQTGLAWRPSW